MKKWQIVTSVVVALVAVMGMAVVAFAQGPQPPANVPQGMGRGRMGGWQQDQNPPALMGHGFRFGVNGGTLVDITAKVTSLSVNDVAAELQSGKTFAQVAQAHGKTAADLNAFIADRKVALDKAVAEGRLTQDVASDLLATMKANVEEHVNSVWQPRGMGYRFTSQQPQGLGPHWSR